LILIVDDNSASREILQARLATHHYDIITAADGEEGLAAAGEARPDLILLDIMMPKIDGIEVCRRLKNDPALPFIPVIMVTAKADTKDVVAGLEAGGDEYLTKPVDQAALVARVKSMLRIKALQDTVAEQAARLRAQLETANKIQSLFWPTLPKLSSGAHIWAASLPAGYVGGDLYDVIVLPDESLLAYVADVAGKGVPAALIMAALSAHIRSEALVQREVDRLLEGVNTACYRLISEEGFFATIVMARFWPDSGWMHLSLGGHLQPVWASGDGLNALPKIKGIPLGVQADARYQKTEIRLSAGESILFFSDGVVEAQNQDRELFGSDRLVGHFGGAPGPPWGEGLLDLVEKWRGGARPNDDLTLLEIWRTVQR
jgi:serine phosphatase RsbU (regulator of sigma subunit)